MFLAFASVLHPFYLGMYVVFAMATAYLQAGLTARVMVPVHVISYRPKLGVLLRRIRRKVKKHDK